MEAPLRALPDSIARPLSRFVEAARSVFGARLRVVVLFGSAAEGRLRATSDVNLMLILDSAVPEDFDHLAPALVLARAAIQLETMFVLESELTDATECFAQKFADIARRHQVLHGFDPFTSLPIPRSAQIFRMRQVLLNFTLRGRELFARHAGHPEQIAHLLAEAAGPLRSCAATLLHLETGVAPAPKEALQLIVDSSGRAEWRSALELISEIRERRVGDSGAVVPAFHAVLEIAGEVRRRADRL